MEPQVINLWTVARSLSTCLAYSFSSRDDTEFLDEPLQAHFFSLHPELIPLLKILPNVSLERKGNEIEKETDPEKVVDMILGPCSKKYRFCKHMAGYLAPTLKRDLLVNAKNVILIRDPISCMASFYHASGGQYQFASNWTSLANVYFELGELGISPIIVHARDLQANPEGTLRALCASLGIEYQPAMLSWEAGQKKNEPIASELFYSAVRKTSGFLKPSRYPKKPFPKELYGMVEQCWPVYAMLKPLAIKPASRSVPLSVPGKQLLVWVDDQLVPAKFVNCTGENICEKMLVYKGKVLNLHDKVSRLENVAKSMGFDRIPNYNLVQKAIFSTLITNGMFDKAIARVFLFKGVMSDSECNCGCTLCVVSEWDETEREEIPHAQGEPIPHLY